jgi:hypothetical protein
MIKLSHDQRFHWFESFAFARARAAATPGGSKVPLFFIMAILFCVPLVLADFPESVADIGMVAAFAIGGALLVAFVLLPLVSRLPNDILITSDRIVIAREGFAFDQIEHAVVGTTTIGGREFQVLSFRTRVGQNHLYGLGRRVSAADLAAFLKRVGVSEPRE